MSEMERGWRFLLEKATEYRNSQGPGSSTAPVPQDADSPGKWSCSNKRCSQLSAWHHVRAELSLHTSSVHLRRLYLLLSHPPQHKE